MNELDLVLEEREIIPRLSRYWISSLAREVKVSPEEHIRRNRRARLNGMARLVCKGLSLTFHIGTLT